MSDKKLSLFQETELKWLRRQVDNIQEKKHKTDEDHSVQHKNIDRELWTAREELDNFVRGLRTMGKNI